MTYSANTSPELVVCEREVMVGEDMSVRQRTSVAVGDFVRVSGSRSVGRVLSTTDDDVTIRYFKGPQENPYEDVRAALSDVARCELEIHTRVFFISGGHWRVGRIDAIPEEGETEYVIALPNSQGILLEAPAFDVRWEHSIDDPFLFLKAGGTESPLLFDQRSSLLIGHERQRTSARGAEGLLTSCVEIHAHQFAAVRTVSNSSIRRFLLADEVGMGKTIEACALIRQFLMESDVSVLVVVPDHLVSQWCSELEHKFRISLSNDSVLVRSHEHPEDWPQEPPDVVVIDEAHHFTRVGDVPEQTRTILVEIAAAAEHVLLLSATPVRSNEVGFLDMLSMLDPATYDSTDVDGFVHRVRERDRLALIVRSLESVDDQFEFAFLAGQLEELFPDDTSLSTLIERAKTGEASDFDRSIARVRAHLSAVYRLDHRVLRTRRSSLVGETFAVRGRKRGRPFTLEVEDPTSESRWELLEFVRTRLAIALDDGLVDNQQAAVAFADLAGRCSSLPAALSEDELTESTQQTLRKALDLDGYEEFGRLLRSIEDRWGRVAPAFVEVLSAAIAVKDVGRVVVASAYTPTAHAAYEQMVEKWGQHRFALHSKRRSVGDNSREVERWEQDPVCSILFCDAGAEEGINLQKADLLVHLDLPWESTRIEQRIGRCDRYDGDDRSAVPSTVVTYGDLPYATAWFEFVADAARVFDRSVSTLQYVLAAVEARQVLQVIGSGPEALMKEVESLQKELDEAAITISAHDALDARSAVVDVGPLVDADEDPEFPEALLSWLEGVGCRARHVRPGVITLRSKGRVQVPISLELSVNRHFNRPLALSRQASVRGGEPLLRAGHPLVDSIVNHLAAADRGASFLMFRPSTGTWPPVPVGRADLVVSVDPERIYTVAEGAFGLRILDLCSEHLPAHHESVFFLADGREVDHPSITRPYDKAKGDINLGSRPAMAQLLTEPIDWASFCDSGHDVAVQIVMQRVADEPGRRAAVERVIEDLLVDVDQRNQRMESELGRASAQEPILEVDQLREVLLEPKIRLIGAGCILLSDQKRIDGAG